MGGDRAPEATVAGALLASADGVDVVLVGDRPRLEEALRAGGRSLPVEHSAEVVDMDEDPAIALRRKPHASVRVAARLLSSGQAQALVSAGPTGATLAAALLEVGRLPAVRRPAVAALLPVPASPGPREVVLLDAGGSPDPQPAGLVAHAHMGVAYAQVRGVPAPRVGLLNVGAEPGKGNAVTRAAFELLRQQVAQFAGNVEPAGVLAGAVDVVVTDGFTGNIFLKTAEAASAGGPKPAPRGPGAAVLLGVAAEVLVAHGAADGAEIAAALRTAAAVAEAGLSGNVAARLAALAGADVGGDGDG